MTRNGNSRRSFLGILGAGSAWLGASTVEACCFGRHKHRYCQPVCPQPWVPPTPPQPPTPPDVTPTSFVRQDISQLGSQLESLRIGVERMKSLPPTDPRSWAFQANMHGTEGPVTSPLFNQCQHESALFFAWHRGYLYYFERILRWASGDPSLTLPYWDWSNQSALPEPYRLPADSSNPLYQEGRLLNDGSPLNKAIVVDALSTALDNPDFSNPDQTGFTWSLEASPHGAVHIAIGGLMAHVPTAANDPIFWLHHCNIDRLWDFWLNLGDGRANLADPTYLNTTFSYADEAGATVTHRVRDIQESRTLGYRYSSVPNPRPNAFAAASAAVAMAAMPAMGHFPMMAAPGEPAEPKPLGLKTETITVNSAPPPVRAMATPGMGGVQAAPARTVVTVRDIEFDKLPELSYGVYVNVPEGVEPSDATADHLVGVINFFGKDTGHDAGGHGGVMAGMGRAKRFSQAFDATRVVARLKTKGLYDDRAPVRVSLRPLVSNPPAGPLPVAAAATQRVEATTKEANIRYRSVEVDRNR